MMEPHKEHVSQGSALGPHGDSRSDGPLKAVPGRVCTQGLGRAEAGCPVPRAQLGFIPPSLRLAIT